MSRLIVCLILLAGCTTTHERKPQSARNDAWVIRELNERIVYDSKAPLVPIVKIRTGYYRESINPQVPFKGCILYLEGLGDSFKNHAPYFESLSQIGYRVVSFDYMGQGGSDGTMNHTRLLDPLFPALQISTIAEIIWNEYQNVSDDMTEHTCAQSKKIVIGWSTGGLAAYEMANRQWADAVILISPGIFPKTLIGEAAKEHGLLLSLKPVISLRTLSSATFTEATDPHVDPINPSNPNSIPLFLGSLLDTANKSHKWKISPTVKGLALISGLKDSYIDPVSTLKTLAQNAPHFTVKSYPESLHEIDNERPDIALAMQQASREFLQSLK